MNLQVVVDNYLFILFIYLQTQYDSEKYNKRTYNASNVEYCTRDVQNGLRIILLFDVN